MADVDMQHIAVIVERVLKERGITASDLQLDIDLNGAVFAEIPELPLDIRVRISAIEKGNGPREVTVDVEHVVVLDTIKLAV